MTARLAIHGGTPLVSEPFPPYNTIGAAEQEAAAEVLQAGELSGFLGTWSEEFFGGRQVRAAERAFAGRLAARYAIATNSASTALEVAVQAVGVEPGDEVIVSPYTMSASAAAVLRGGGIPVFADVEDETFCLDPQSVAHRVSSRTRAILVTHLFGHPARMEGLEQIAEEHQLALVEDAAQSIGATYHGRETATMGSAGILSLNRHKIIHCGEGGFVVTNDDCIARRAQLIRNHGETVVEDAQWEDDIPYSLGSNYRMTELHAAIARVQLTRLESLLATRRGLAQQLTKRLRLVPGIVPPVVAPGCTHSYYRYAVRVTEPILGRIDRGLFAAALRAEGVPVIEGYVRPLYMQAIYQRRAARPGGFPWSLAEPGSLSYAEGACPVVERLDADELLLLDVCREPLAARDIDLVSDAFEKVVTGLPELESSVAV
jgi:perosamine synthetase